MDDPNNDFGDIADMEAVVYGEGGLEGHIVTTRDAKSKQ